MSDPRHPTHDQLLPLIEALVNGTIDDADFARLDQMLRDDPAARRFYRRYMNLHAALPGLVGGQPRMTLRLSDAAADEIELDPADSAAVEALAELARRHEESLLEPISLTGYRKPPRHEPVTPARRAVRIKARLVLAGALAAAVALALGLVMVVSLLAPADQPTAQQPPQQDPARPVASLTDARDAAWTDGQDNPIDLRVGDPLSPGARLILSDGFAELTTARGALVTLEAPCEIELLDHDNALRLHAGKLVGICETPSSKGLLVRTPYMDVTDLGTRFGVDASQPDAIEVHVFKGVVRVDRPATGSAAAQRQTLTQGQAVRAGADATRDRLVSIPTAPDRFALSLEKRLIAASGRGQVSGEIDPNWRVVAVDGKPITENTEMTVWSHPDNAVDRADTKWVRVNNALNPPGAKSVLFTCRSDFELPAAASHELVIRARADNKLAALRINGHALSVPKNRVGVGLEWLTWTLAEHFQPGPNTIEIDIDERLPDNNKFNSSGLIAELELQTR